MNALQEKIEEVCALSPYLNDDSISFPSMRLYTQPLCVVIQQLLMCGEITSFLLHIQLKGREVS